MFKDDGDKDVSEEQEEEDSKNDSLSNSTQKRIQMRRKLSDMKKLAEEDVNEVGADDNPLDKEKFNIIKAAKEDQEDQRDFLKKIRDVARGKLDPKELDKYTDEDDINVDTLINDGAFSKRKMQRKYLQKKKHLEETQAKLKHVQEEEMRPQRRRRRPKHRGHPRMKQDSAVQISQTATDQAKKELNELVKDSEDYADKTKKMYKEYHKDDNTK